MEELSIEQKAKAYDEAIEKLRNAFYVNNSRMCEEYRNAVLKIIEPIFPELKESEDEKIRKWIVRTLKSLNNSSIQIDGAYEMMLPAISWLEKQGERKLVDKVEPKFKVGDWVVHDMSDGKKVIRQIVNMTNKSYILDGEDFNIFYFNDLENDYHLWTIQDAKDGDVIFYDSRWTCIFKCIHGIWYSSYCFITADGEFHTGYERHLVDAKLNGNAHPATKEQCDVLMKTMADAKYTFDFEKKELKKIEQEKNMDNKLTNFEHSLKHIMEEAIECGDTHNLKADADMLLRLAQKSNEWHREDEQSLNACLGYIPDEFLRRWLKDIIHAKYDKTAENVEPKFNVGDWVVDKNGTVQQILSYKNGIYKHTNGYSSKMFEDEWRLWDITKDAKDGDVLAVNNEVFIYAHRKQMYPIAVAHCFLDSAGGFHLDGEFGYMENGNLISLATKEQRDILLQKMKEAGYDWDSRTNKMIFNND